MKLIKKIAITLVMVAVSFTSLLAFGIPKTYAAGFSLSPTSTTITVGQSVTITFSSSGYIGRVDISGAASGSFWMEGSTSKSYKITGSSVGTMTVYANATNVSDEVGSPDPFNLSASATINVVAPTTPTPPPSNEGNNGGNSGNSGNTGNSGNSGTKAPGENTTTEEKSSDASLSEFTISQGTLSPEFSADTTEYSVSLGKDVTTLSINAKASHAGATVSGTGEQILKPGMNEFNVLCTAEDGSTRTYVLKVTVDEAPSVFIEYNGNKLGVVKDTSYVSLPTGFEETKVTLEGSEIIAWNNPLNKLTIVYLVDEANEKNFYLYDETTKTITSIYKPMGLLGRNIAVIDIPKELQEKVGLIYSEVEVSGVKMMGWKFKDAAFENYTLIYVMDEQGKMVYYLHEKGEDTLQLYSGQAAMTQAQAEEQVSAMKQRMMLMIALLVTNILTLALLLVKVFKKPKRKLPVSSKANTHEGKMIKEEDLPLGHRVFKSFNEDEANENDLKDESDI